MWLWEIIMYEAATCAPYFGEASLWVNIYNVILSDDNNDILLLLSSDTNWRFCAYVYNDMGDDD